MRNLETLNSSVYSRVHMSERNVNPNETLITSNCLKVAFRSWNGSIRNMPKNYPYHHAHLLHNVTSGVTPVRV